LFQLMNKEFDADPCLNCSIRKMLREGCCTQDVGYGTKLIENRNTGVRVEVCSRLIADDGHPYCGEYLDRNKNGMCAGFSCESKRRYDAGA